MQTCKNNTWFDDGKHVWFNYTLRAPVKIDPPTKMELRWDKFKDAMIYFKRFYVILGIFVVIDKHFY